MPKYLCKLCGHANDPVEYAMTKLQSRWYHNICLERVSRYAINNFDIELDRRLQVVRFKRKGGKT